ncbi:adaptor protein STE50 [Aspergillus candidus]|uniref:MAPKKK cascade protein kinase regulator Ste50 n=1 Tax=Aspergillus candidus TaxID=41067 RepID=A0A2I2F8T0_ASPCN|nr:MAPKKK cascade protein kinase regulator Ste50 [Aspergillus candidus]PLB37044.1 MAPKKK cascade protein kinase regulator Ste50 [Aspergillus candidus]
MPPITLQPTSYHADSDADDEYERSVVTSPHLASDSEASPLVSEFPSAQHTPTTFANADESAQWPTTVITEWTVDECAGFLAALGLRQYRNAFLENEIVGEALIALKHDELKEMGIASVGHRLTILKSVYETKVKQDIPLDADHYIPLSADQSMNENASQEDVARLIQSIRLRDERIVTVESELRRMAEDYRRLREELLPVFKMAKDRSQPLPPPSTLSGTTIEGYHDSQTLTSPSGITLLDRAASGISRSFSKRAGGTTPKNNSPTHIPPSIHEVRSYHDGLDPSTAGGLPGASHLSSMNNGKAQLSPGIPSPTSPGNHYTASQILGSRSYTQPNSRHDPHDDPPPSRSDRLQPTPTQATRPDLPSRSDSRAGAGTAGSGGGGGSSGGGDPPSVEIFKSFRVSMDDPCYRVLPAALKKYQINADWKQYALYIVYGDQERCLGLEEKPLILFKQLEKEGRKPMFMLRRQIHAAEGAPYTGGGSAPNSAGFEGRQGQINLPGGVL